jgi:hypothetical protein
MPTDAATIPPAQRSERVWSNGELCVIDDSNFYLYGSISFDILGHEDQFSWGAWVKLSEELFFWYQDLLDADGREKNASFAATLETDIPFYPPTIGLPLMVRVQALGLRPEFVLEHGTHSLIHDQESGVSTDRIQEIKQWFNDMRK